ncbi:MAG: hypothetical protein AAFQ79_05055 [Pseudomonadota bacterium]
MLGTAHSTAEALRRETDGVALTEYVVLLGLFIAGLLLASVLFGGGNYSALTLWGQWISDVRSGVTWTGSE